MRKPYPHLTLLALFTLALPPVSKAGAPAPDQILLIGLSADKSVQTQIIPAATYRKTLATAFSAVHDSILPTLESKQERTAKANQWHVGSVGVGIGLSGTLGLGPILSATLSAHLRMIFTNRLNPFYPD